MSVEVVREERARYDHLTGVERAGTVTNAVARRLGAGLLYNPGGNNWRERSTDLIILPDGTWVDILRDGEGVAEPVWDVKPGKADMSLWRAPFEDGPTRPQEPPAEPPIGEPPVVEVRCSCGSEDVLKALLAEVKLLRASVERGVPVVLRFR